MNATYEWEPVRSRIASLGRDPDATDIADALRWCGHVVSDASGLVFMNARYGYHVHAQIVGRDGTVEMAAPTTALTNHALNHGHAWPENWVPRFRDAYRIQMNAWVRSCTGGPPVGASAWDGYVATAIAEQVVAALATGARTALTFNTPPDLYR